MFEKRSLGIAFEADGTVTAVELTSHVRTVTLTGAWSIEPEGSDRFESWKQAVDRLRERGVDLDNAVIGIPDSLVYRKHLSFPFSGRKRIKQVLNSELEGEIPLPVDGVVADFITGQSQGSELHGTAIACDMNIMSRFLEITGPGVRLNGVQTASIGLAATALRAGIGEGVAVRSASGEAILLEFRSSRVRAIKRLPLGKDEESN